MRTVQPDIVVTSPDGDYLMVVEVKRNDIGIRRQNAVEMVKRYMASVGCSVGLVVSGEHVVLLRDSLEKFNGESIYIVGEAKLPDSLLPPANEQWKEKRELAFEFESRELAFEFESRVQQWLEELKISSNVKKLPDDLRTLLGEPIINLLRLGEVRAAGPRWSEVER